MCSVSISPKAWWSDEVSPHSICRGTAGEPECQEKTTAFEKRTDKLFLALGAAMGGTQNLGGE